MQTIIDGLKPTPHCRVTIDDDQLGKKRGFPHPNRRTCTIESIEIEDLNLVIEQSSHLIDWWRYNMSN
ncbi:hypothetical protein MRB53_034368 [Persea americana]|uniref:Uncharacterized protein n=1 Tax=Persea americana TaxID=3435 RepID=A0ACC2KXW8_PERAE|nr:hypothetical protein MRB53_034368 [Persea americana]